MYIHITYPQYLLTHHPSSSQWTFKDKAGLALFGSLVAGTTCLGIWQTQRYFWKIDQVTQRKEGLEKEPIALPLAL